MWLNNSDKKIVYMDWDLTLYHNPMLHSTIMDLCTTLKLSDEEKMKVINELLVKHYNYSFKSMAEDMARISDKALYDFVSERELKNLEKTHYAEIEWFQLYDDSIDFIKELKWIGIKTALASNATDFYRLISRKKFNLDKLLDHIYLTCELGYAKNGKEFYRKIMNDTWVLSTQATMIGDNIKADILASQDAWLQAIHILRNDDSHKKDQFSKHLSTSNLWDNEQWFQTVSDLSQALQIIKDRK